MEKNNTRNKQHPKKVVDDLSQAEILDILYCRDLACPKCKGPIGECDEIWNCNACYSSVHLGCLNIKETKIGNLNTFKWVCEGCKENYTQNERPFYNCFCGKYYENKEFNNNFDDSIYPHSCGCQCGFLINKNIKCNLPCHRGPHLHIENSNKLLFNKSTNKNSNEEENKTINTTKNKTLDQYFPLVRIEQSSNNTRIINLKGKIHVYGPKCDLIENVVYCGRKNYLGGWQLDQSIWANPFKVKDYKTNEEACSKYEEYLRSNKKLLDELPKLVGKKLACWCYPNACHTEVIIKLMKEKI